MSTIYIIVARRYFVWCFRYFGNIILKLVLTSINSSRTNFTQSALCRLPTFIIDYLYMYKFVFVTVTVPNVPLLVRSLFWKRCLVLTSINSYINNETVSVIGFICRVLIFLPEACRSDIIQKLQKRELVCKCLEQCRCIAKYSHPDFREY